MRWTALFADLEAQLAAAEAAELAGEVADRQRLEMARVAFLDRLRGAAGGDVVVGLVSGDVLHATVDRAGPDWVLLAVPGQPDALVPLDAVTWVRGLPGHARPPAGVGVVEARLDLGYVLRGLARDRALVRIGLVDGSTVEGTIDRVGGDHLDLAEHAADDHRRPGAVSGVRTLPFRALVMLRQP